MRLGKGMTKYHTILFSYDINDRKQMEKMGRNKGVFQNRL